MMVQEQTPIIIKNYPLTFKFSNNTKERTNFLEEVIEFCKKEQPTFIEDCLSVAEKIIIVGDHNVGKTCLVRRYCENTFTDGYKSTIGVDFIYKQFNILGRDFTLHIWDTAGQEQFRSISKAYFRGATAVLIVFDLENMNSFINTQIWLQEVQNELTTNFFKFLIGTKSDKNHVVTYEMGQEVASKIGAEYWECSAKTGEYVKNLFDRIAVVLFESSIIRFLYSNHQDCETDINKNFPTITANSNNQDKESKCCF
jgi:small GTP-binding protein